MEAKLKKIEDGSVELTVSLAKEELNEYIRKIESRFGQDVEVPGFRKGKAPQDLVRKNLNPDLVRETALELAVSDSLQKAVQENELDIAASNKLDIKENTTDKLVYTALLNIYPALTLPNIESIAVSRKAPQVTEQEIGETVNTLRNMRAKFSAKEDVAQSGDRVEVDFSVSQNGKVIQGGESKNHPLIIGGKNFIPGFEDQLIGMKATDTKKFSLTAPEDYYHKEIAGKKLDFEVTMNLVQQVQLPELNDELAQTLGKFSTVEELKKNIKESLLQEKASKEQERVRLEVLTTIAEKIKLDPPTFLVKQQLESMTEQFGRDLQSKGLEMTMYLAQMKKSIEDLHKDWQKDAKKQAGLVLVLRAIARSQNISASSEEIEGALNLAVQAAMSRGQANIDNVDTTQLRERIEDRLIQEKTFEYIEKVCVKV